MRFAVLCSLLVSAQLLGCDAEAVSLVVDVRTDLVPGIEIGQLRVELPDRGESTLAMLDRSSPSGTPVRVAEWNALPPRDGRLVAVRAYSPAGTLVVERDALVDNRTSRVVQIVLTRACRGQLCPGGQACVAGSCVDPRCLVGDEPECPGTLCDGCDPLAECDVPVCENGACLHDADPLVCDPGFVCLPDEGCVLDPDASDAGVPDADSGVADAAAPDAGARDGGPADAGPADAGSPPECRAPGGACDYVRQDCVSGQACVPRLMGADVEARCVPAGAGMDTACSDVAPCAPGWDCLGGRCVEVCCPGRGLTTCSVAGMACTTNADALSGHCLADACDVLSQLGCAAGQACYEVADGVPSCEPAGTVALGRACSAQAECSPGLGCNDSGRCSAYCDAALLPCEDGVECVLAGGRRSGHCSTDRCDPIADTGCAAGFSCYVAGSLSTACSPTGTSPLGSSCTVITDCAPGLRCASRECQELCHPLTAPCSGGRMCIPITSLSPYGGCI